MHEDLHEEPRTHFTDKAVRLGFAGGTRLSQPGQFPPAGPAPSCPAARLGPGWGGLPFPEYQGSGPRPSWACVTAPTVPNPEGAGMSRAGAWVFGGQRRESLTRAGAHLCPWPPSALLALAQGGACCPQGRAGLHYRR